MRVFFFFMAVFLLSLPLQAQTPEGRYEFDMHVPNYMARPEYDLLVNRLINETPGVYNYTFLRAQYTQIEEYDPVGNEAIKSLLERAYIVDTSDDPDKVEAALAGYKSLIRTHMAHIDVIFEAEKLSRLNPALGDPKFYRKVYKGLLQNVLDSGTGRSLNDSYDVVTLEEETLLLEKLDVEVVDTQSRHSGKVYYNIHSVIDNETGAPHSIFVNITRPMEFLARRARAQNQDINPFQ